uniref:Transient receptor potential cation channel, subfamily M, member 5 n=1 Tax=Gouania willdenowi TaxID=441366 RepID=A0A8C5D4X4_GOUWI
MNKCSVSVRVLLGCSCCSTLDETLEDAARGLAGKMRRDKGHWAAGRFVRVSSNAEPVLIYQMLTEEWGLSPPHLVVALVGGDEVAQMKPWLRDTLRKGLVKAAQSTGAWILTNGLRFGITKHLGQAVRDHSLASTSSKVRVVAIGVAPWNMIHNREALLTAKVKAWLMAAGTGTGAGDHPSPSSSGGRTSIYILCVCVCVCVCSSACKSQSQEAQDFLDELKLAVAWNRVDIAKSDIFNGDVEWKACDLEEVMMDALINDKPDFVRLFVDNGVNLGEFLTYGRLQDLYWSVSEKSLLHNLLLKKYEEKQILLGAARSAGPPVHHPPEQGDRKPRFTLYEVAKVLKDFLHDSCKGFYQKIPAVSHTFIIRKFNHLFLNCSLTCEHPWRDLFLWAVLQNRQMMANYFWAMGPEAVAAALAGCKILKEMARLESEAESARSMKEAKYEQFALDVFGECYSNSEDRAYALLVRRTHCWSKSTVLNLATEADAKSFFAHDGVQALLTKIWWGAMTTDTAISKLVVSFFCPPLIWTNLIKFSEEELDNRSGNEQFAELDSLDTEKALLCASVWWRFLLRRWRRFWSAPVTVFLGNVIMYFAFLCLFTYVLLLDFRPPPPLGPGPPEIMLYFWVFTLVLEELRQSFFTDEEISILKKFKLYVEDNWNKCDMVAISLFVVGVSCRMVKHTYEAGRTVLAIDFMVFTLRLIHIFAIHKQLGPKIIIVERMMKDVFFFLFFLSVWLIAYGVATQALLHPNDPRIDWVFRRALYRPYLHIFGQIPLEEIDAARMPQSNCTNDSQEIILGLRPPCANVYANWLVILLLVIYLLVTNVLLLNLLIAMFSYTFQVVQGNTDIFWKFQRYNLIVEYHSRPALAPPFIIISHLSQLLLSLVTQPESKQEHLGRGHTHTHTPTQGLTHCWCPQSESFLLAWTKGSSPGRRCRRRTTWVQSLLKIVGGVKDQEKRLVSMESQVQTCYHMTSCRCVCV